jgi:hypothetical protein
MPNVTAANSNFPPTNIAPQQPAPSATMPRQATTSNATSGRRVESLPTSHRAPSYSEPAPESSIAGPSFLGLNMPIARDGGRRDADYDDRYSDSYSGRDNQRDSSGNLDYLLEDEEEPKRGWGKVLLGLVALALAVGLGYLHFQQGGFEWLRNLDKKPASAGADGAQGGANSAGANGAPATPDNASAQPGTAPAPGAANAPAATNSDSDSPTTIPTQNSQNAAAAQDAATQNATPGNAAPAATAGTAADSGTRAKSTPAAQVPAKAEENSDSDEESSDAEAPAAPKARTKTAVAKPAAKPSPGRAIDRVQEAERYIYGRGVPQDCDHGVRLLKADQTDAKAMISLGGLYTTGTCTPRDLPTAYRWFAMALHKDPDNQALQNDLQKLWSQMTQPERQLAIKLSQ